MSNVLPATFSEQTYSKRSSPFVVFVEGNIGAGKSTFLNHFQKFNDVHVCSEPVEKWRHFGGHNLLDLLYKESDRWAFPFQIYATLTNLQIISEQTPKPIKLVERSLYAARYCFVEAMFANDVLHKGMYDILQEWYNYIDENIDDVKPDLIVYLRTTPETVCGRVEARGRSEEAVVNLKYLKQLHELHEDWLIRGRKPQPAPVLVLNADFNMDNICAEYVRAESFIFQTN